MGKDETVALTAFVVIALHHGLSVFQDEGTQELKQRVVRAPVGLPFTRPQLPPFLFRNPGVQPRDLPPYFLLGNLHLKGNLILGDESKCWAPGCSCSCHHSLCPDTDQGP